MEKENPSTRMDKWLWSVRLFKTRSIATEACKTGSVKLNGANTKPAKDLKIGDKLSIKRMPIVLEVEVIGFPKSRVGAPLVELYMKNLTSPEEYEKLKMRLASAFVTRDARTGRPTKKERRDIDEFDVLDWMENGDEKA